jgi:hypothetical protein
MDIDMARACAFMTSHARLLERRRFAFLTGQGRAEDLLSALVAYRNSDGGFGWGLEPDLRSAESQPVGALHALEMLAEVGPDGGAAEPAGSLCDWLGSVTLPDGGLPFALPLADPAGSARWWGQVDSGVSSLHLTSAVAAVAHQVARQDPGVRGHAWLGRASRYCAERIARLDRPTNALEFRYVLWFLDAAHDVVPEAPAELRRLGGLLSDDGVMAVEGGVDGESLRPLDFSPHPGRPLRGLLAPEAIGKDLERLAGGQQDDGGWAVDFASPTTAGSLEWRGYATVSAIKTLLAHQDQDGKTP